MHTIGKSITKHMDTYRTLGALLLEEERGAKHSFPGETGNRSQETGDSRHEQGDKRQEIGIIMILG